MKFKMSISMAFYIAKQFLLGVFIAFMAFAVLILLIDLLELFRRAQDAKIKWTTIFYMAFLHLPANGQEVMPFAILIGTVLSFGKMARNSELVVMRASGLSAWQFLTPALVMGAMLGLIVTMIVNPFSAIMVRKFERLSDKYFEHSRAAMAMEISSGLWLRQTRNYYDYHTDKPKNVDGEIVIHAREVDGGKAIKLKNPVFFIYGDNYKFIKRINADEAILDKDKNSPDPNAWLWKLKNSVTTIPGQISEKEVVAEQDISTYLTVKDVHNSLASPESIPFWTMPDFISTLTLSGFSATNYRMKYHTLLANPFLYIGMIIIASVFSMRHARHSKTIFLLGSSIISGFLIYFTTNLVSSLGVGGTIPVVLAVWAPIVAAILIGAGVLMQLEDG
jgi:lipopolysaccharide export system permease protein